MEKLRVSIILGLLTNGENLPPFAIFKGIKDGRKEKNLKGNKFVKNNEIYIDCQKNS